MNNLKFHTVTLISSFSLLTVLLRISENTLAAHLDAAYTLNVGSRLKNGKLAMLKTFLQKLEPLASGVSLGVVQSCTEYICSPPPPVTHTHKI